MDNSNVIDFYTRKNYNEITYSNSARYDELIGSHGIYFGMLCHDSGEQMHRMIEELKVITERIKQQHQRQLEVWDEYMELLGYCLDYLGGPCRKELYEPLDFDKDSFFVDENNNMWLLKEKYHHCRNRRKNESGTPGRVPPFFKQENPLALPNFLNIGFTLKIGVQPVISDLFCPVEQYYLFF